jgi:cold shock CspA family protein
MGRSQETWNKKEVRNRKEKNRKDKEKKKLERKKNTRDGNNLDDMIAYVDEFGKISSTPPDLSQRVLIKAEDIELSGHKNRDADVVDTVRKGIVSFFNESKGYGFIEDTVTRESIFVHVSGLTEPIKENNKVSFEVEKGVKGLNAVKVKVDR